jgi:hypothetical protein
MLGFGLACKIWKALPQTRTKKVNEPVVSKANVT